jgi:hypothetical protein
MKLAALATPMELSDSQDAVTLTSRYIADADDVEACGIDAESETL